jgi:hypothetical protein
MWIGMRKPECNFAIMLCMIHVKYTHVTLQKILIFNKLSQIKENC